MRADQLPGAKYGLPRTAAQRAVGRIRRAGRHMVDASGAPLVIRGANQGHGELGNDGDAALGTAAGGNGQRIVSRTWGTWGTGIVNGEDVTHPSYSSIAYKQYLYARLKANRDAGGINVLAFDENCGQTERPGDPVCEFVVTGTPETLWTAGGAPKRAQHIARVVWHAKEFLGLIDAIEPIVEPHPTAGNTLPSGNKKLDVQQLQQEIMDAVLAVDPEMIFIIGPADSYFNSALAGWWRDDWAAYPIWWTCNLLDGAASNTATLPASIQVLTDFSTLHNAPTIVQQVSTQKSSEDDYNTANGFAAGECRLMRNVLAQLNAAGISWLWWEWIGPAANYPTLPGGTSGIYNGDSVTRFVNSVRLAEFTTACAATRVYP